MELESARRRPRSIRRAEAKRRSRPTVDDKSATFARVVADHRISTEPRSLGAIGMRCCQGAACMAEITNIHRGCFPDVGGTEPALGPP